jgi:GT2 family glycosyltransferase
MITIVIVNWNSGPYLQRCVQSLRDNAEDAEIVVVDNASHDGSLDFATGREGGMLVLRNRENIGFGPACNTGWRRGRGTEILFLNPDTEALPGSVAGLCRSLLGNSGIWATAGNLVDRLHRTQAGFNVRGFPTVASVAAELLLLDEIWPHNPWTRGYRMSGWDHASARDVEQPAAACLMVRRSVLERLGGFDEAFRPAWFEDVDLCRRIHDHGGRISFQPDARFLHHGGSSLACMKPGEFLEYFHCNQIRYFAKHSGPTAARRVRQLIVAGMCLRALVSLVRPVLRDRSRVDSARIFARAARRFRAAGGKVL